MRERINYTVGLGRSKWGGGEGANEQSPWQLSSKRCSSDEEGGWAIKYLLLVKEKNR